MEDRNELLAHGNVWKTLFKLSLPIILSQLINVLYNIVDRIYIGQGISQEAFSGVGIAFPIIIIVTSFAGLFGMGGAPLASIKLGEGNKEEARKIMNNSFSSLIYSGLLLTAIVTIFTNPILYLFGANELIIKYAYDYLFVYSIGSVFVMLAVGMNSYITAQGYTKTAMFSVVIGAVLNIILDPIMIYVFKLGVKGAAIATVISQAVSAIYVVSFLSSKHSGLRLDYSKFGRINPKTLFAIMGLGVSPFIMQSTEAAVQIVFNKGIGANTTPEQAIVYLALMTSLISLMQFVMLPMQGLVQGAQPLISYNYGAYNIPRVKESVKKMFILTVGYSFFCFLLIELLPSQLVSIFNSSPELMEIAPRLTRIFYIGFSVMGIQIACQNTFLALGQSVVSLILALLRKVVLLIPIALILPHFIGVDGVFIAEAIADCLAVLATAITFACMIGKILKKREKAS